MHAAKASNASVWTSSGTPVNCGALPTHWKCKYNCNSNANCIHSLQSDGYTGDNSLFGSLVNISMPEKIVASEIFSTQNKQKHLNRLFSVRIVMYQHGRLYRTYA